MFEAATSQAHRDAIARAHTERAAVFAAGIAWLRTALTLRSHGAAVASAH
ncbi:hypothetical protein [Shimia ponticola]|nr:hypothetical protein [Shimia ponticola]